MNPLSFDSELLSSPRVRIALMLLAVALTLFAAAFVRAVRLESLPPASPAAESHAVTEGLPPRATQVDAEHVVQADLFSASRSAPGERYPMPGEERGEASTPAGPPAPKPNVLGTGITLDGTVFATVQLPNNPSRIVRIGDRLGIYTVVAITRGTVTFRAAGAAPFQVNAS